MKAMITLQTYFKRLLALFLLITTPNMLNSGSITMDVTAGLTATINFPDSVCMNQLFTVEYILTATTDQPALTSWAGQIPQAEFTVGQVNYMSNTVTFGAYDPTVQPPMGTEIGSGSWGFSDGFPVGTQTLTITYRSTSVGTISFQTILNVPQPLGFPFPFTFPALQPITIIAKTETVCLGDSVTIDAFAGNSTCNPPLTLSSVTQPPLGEGTATFSGSTITYNATGTSAGSTSFSYTLEDSASNAATAPITITLENCCTLTANTLTATASVGKSVTINALAGNVGTCPPITIDSVTQPPAGQGTTTFSGDIITYTAPATVPSDEPVLFSYSLKDAFDDVAVGFAKVTVTNCSLTVNPLTAATCLGNSVTINALVGDNGSCPPLTVTAVSTPANGGTVTFTSSTITYTTPTTQPSSEKDTFTYTVTDAQGNSASSTVTVTIINQKVVDPFIQLYDQLYFNV